MSAMTKQAMAIIVAAVLLLAVVARAQEKGQEQDQGPQTVTIVRNCMGCHGVNGISPGAIPTIAGKSAAYLVERMTAFRDGTRESTVMGRLLKGFDDEDIRRVADFFADEKLTTQK